MKKTENYELNIAEGTDRYNHLIVDNPNYEAIDKQMKLNENATVGTATELKTGGVHALTRANADIPVFRFTATSNYEVTDSFTVDGELVTALLPDGSTLPDATYVIGSEVLCCLNGTRLTVFTGNATKSRDSEKLGGELPSYYATAEAVETAQKTADATEVLVNQLNTHLTALGFKFTEKNIGDITISANGYITLIDDDFKGKIVTLGNFGKSNADIALFHTSEDKIYLMSKSGGTITNVRLRLCELVKV